MKLWREKYRPQTIEEYVWKDNDLKDQVDYWLANKALPDIMLAGKPGTGKTSLARLLLKLLDIPSCDILDINATKERNIDTIQNKIVNFVSSWALGPTGIKYILLDEADKMSPLSQDFLRSEMERYTDVSRFIMTLNYPNKIIPALHSRFQVFTFKTLNYEQFMTKAVEILLTENIEIDADALEYYIEKSYPDLRKCINLLQKNSISGKLTIENDDIENKDYLIDMVDLFKQGKYLEARKLIVSQASTDEYPEIYRFLYQNLNLWGDSQEIQDNALLIIRNGIVNHQLVADVEINLAATLCELARLCT